MRVTAVEEIPSHPSQLTVSEKTMLLDAVFEASLINIVSQSYVGGPCVNRRKGNAGEDVGERGILFTAGGNVDFHNGNQCGGPLNINRVTT